MNNPPTISIVTPVYNGMPQIRRTLESLRQQSVPFEHLVMDACSKDGTAETAREYTSQYNVTVISERDEGHFDAVSKGFARAKGDVLAWLNAGDAYMPYTLPLVQRVFATHPEIEWITGIPAYYYEDRDIACIEPVVPTYSRTVIRRGWHNGYWLPHLQQESMFWRRSLWDRSRATDLLKGQGRGKGYGIDYHLWRRFAEHARLHTVCSMLSSFAFTPGQITEKYRRQYFEECGVKNPPDHPFRPTNYLWAFYSFLKAPSTIKEKHLK
jgi:glycosyltransferase involved in cell wall biosynthesis